MTKAELTSTSLFFTALIFLSVIPCGLYAQPDQRLIIYLNHPLSDNQSALLHENIASQTDSAHELAESSSSQRWIIVLSPPLPTTQLDMLIHDLARLSFVEHVEQDILLLKKAPAMQQIK